MTYTELTEARLRLGLTETQMARLLGVALSTYAGWAGHRNRKPGVPRYISNSVEAHEALSRAALGRLMAARKI